MLAIDKIHVFCKYLSQFSTIFFFSSSFSTIFCLEMPKCLSRLLNIGPDVSLLSIPGVIEITRLSPRMPFNTLAIFIAHSALYDFFGDAQMSLSALKNSPNVSSLSVQYCTESTALSTRMSDIVTFTYILVHIAWWNFRCNT